MNFYSILLLFLQNSLAREQYPWYGSQSPGGADELDEDVELLLKQGLKIGYLPKSTQNGNTDYQNACFYAD